MQLRRAVQEFATVGWARLDRRRADELQALPEGDQLALETAIHEIDRVLQSIWPTGPQDHERHARLSFRIGQTATLVGERIVAMNMAGEADERIAHVAAVLTEKVLNAYFAGRIQQFAILRGRDISDFAPAIAAAAIAYRQAALGEASSAPAAILERLGLQNGAALSANDLRGIAEGLLQGLRQADAQIIGVVQGYERAARHVFTPQPEELGNESDRLRRSILGGGPTAKPSIRTGTLVAFASSARGGSTTARIEGSLELFRSIVAVARIRNARKGLAPTRQALLDQGLRGLARLDLIVRNERFLHSLVEGRWRDIEKELRFLAQRNPKESPVVPLPHDMEALECMALYLQDLVSQGFPIGRVLAEFRHSGYLTFGPTEEQFLLRSTMYAARKYAANFACHSHPRFKEAGRAGMRAEVVLQILSGLEVELRERERLNDSELLDYGHDRIQDLLNTGTLRLEEAETALDLLDDMVTRVRAGQEVRYLTSLLGLDGTIPEDIIASYAGLPHTRRFALAALPSSRFFSLYARNGQTMKELQQDVYGRWMRYRQQAPAGKDVVPVQLRFPETRAGVREIKSGRKLFRRTLSDFMVDVETIEGETEDQSRQTQKDPQEWKARQPRKQTAGRRTF